MKIQAGIAQLVEPHVANVVVAGSSPVSRSSKKNGIMEYWKIGIMGVLPNR